MEKRVIIERHLRKRATNLLECFHLGNYREFHEARGAEMVYGSPVFVVLMARCRQQIIYELRPRRLSSIAQVPQRPVTLDDVSPIVTVVVAAPEGTTGRGTLGNEEINNLK